MSAARCVTLKPNSTFAIHDFDEEDPWRSTAGATPSTRSTLCRSPGAAAGPSSGRGHGAPRGDRVHIETDPLNPHLGETIRPGIVESAASLDDRDVDRVDGEVRFIEIVPTADVPELSQRRHVSACGRPTVPRRPRRHVHDA